MADGILKQREPPQERLLRSATQRRNTVMSSEALATGVPMQSPKNSRVFLSSPAPGSLDKQHTAMLR